MTKQEKFSCPHCGLRYDTRPDWAGQKAKCKCCKNAFTIPGTPSAKADSRCNIPVGFGEENPVPEAKIVGNPSSPNPVPEAKVIVNVEEEGFLEPIEEVDVSIYAATEMSDSTGPFENVFSENLLDAVTGGGPLQQPSSLTTCRKRFARVMDNSLGKLLVCLGGGVTIVCLFMVFLLVFSTKRDVVSQATSARTQVTLNEIQNNGFAEKDIDEVVDLGTDTSKTADSFETLDMDLLGDPFEVVGDTKPDTKDKSPLNLSSTGTASIDQVLEQLKSVSASDVKRILKLLSLYQPVDEKRQAVCRTMILLLENDGFAFACREITDVLVAWMTPEVSDDLVRVMKASNSYASTELIKQLARVQDDKVAVTVVELWTKKPLFLKEAVIALGGRAEEPLWEVLKSSNPKLQIEACNLLAQQGTQKSVMKLAELAYTKDKDHAVAHAAEDAMKALNAREN